MLDHSENFELEKEYEQIWDSIRYKKVDELYALTEEVINIIDSHIDDKLLFHVVLLIFYYFYKIAFKNMDNIFGISRSLALAILVVGFLFLPPTIQVTLIIIFIVSFLLKTLQSQKAHNDTATTI